MTRSYIAGLLQIDGQVYPITGTPADGDVLAIDTVSGIVEPVSPGSINVFVADIEVSLPSGNTLGKYENGDTIPATGMTFEEVIRDIAIADIAPTYTPATLSLSDTATNENEVGTAYTNTLTATFTKNDGGNLSEIRIQKNGSDITPNGSTSPFAKSDSDAYPNGTTTYIAYANYLAGAVKNYSPSGTPDARTPAIRTTSAPQSAHTNFASSSVTLTGVYKQFYGPVSAAPTNSAQVRALASSRLLNASNSWNLTTGTVERIFSFAIPATQTLVSVVDLDALNAVITASYILSTFNVNDAGGTPVSYKVYTMTNAVPYSETHRHQITVA